MLLSLSWKELTGHGTACPMTMQTSVDTATIVTQHQGCLAFGEDKVFGTIPSGGPFVICLVYVCFVQNGQNLQWLPTSTPESQHQLLGALGNLAPLVLQQIQDLEL